MRLKYYLFVMFMIVEGWYQEIRKELWMSGFPV